MLGFHPKYLVPNAFTALSMLFGLASAAASAHGRYDLAAWMILWGVLLDKLDGTAARLFKASSAFGVQYDSFADFVAFGVAPAALCWFRLKDHAAFAGPMQWVLIGAAGLYVIAVSGRLARFNISDPPGGDRYFYGIPTTMMGALLGSFYLSWESQRWPEAALLAFPAYLVVGAALMVSGIRLPKLKRRGNLLIDAFQIANVGVAYVIAPLRLWPEVLLGQAAFYLVVGVGFCLVRPPRIQSEDLDAGGAPGDHPDLKPAG